jgi:beta-phosphoglucomutase-like phosphatase (HAD superfamily)
MIVIAGDRGLAGGYNNNVFRTVREYPDAAIIPIGKRACDKFGAGYVSCEKFSSADADALTEKVAAAVTPSFKAFVKALTDKGLKVVIATRANLDVLKPALEGLDPELVQPYQEVSMTYGNGKWDAWTRALNANGLINVLTVGVTGSGHGVKAVLVAGMSAVAVIHDHVAYQDFGGADVAVEKLDAKVADEVFRMLHL